MAELFTNQVELIISALPDEDQQDFIMKEIGPKHEQSLTAGSIKRFVFALLCILLVSNVIAQWAVQTQELLPQWGEYTLYSTLLLCLALPCLYVFEVRPLIFLINKLAKVEQSALITSELLNNLITTSSVILFSMRVDGEQLHTEWVSNGTLESMLGYSEEDVMQPDWWLTYLHPQDRASTIVATAKLFQGEPVAYDYRFMHKNGSEVWIHDEQKLVCDKDGMMTHMVSTWADITKQKMTELELCIGDHMFEANKGIITTDANMIIQGVNPVFTRITGYTAKDIVGKTPAIFKSGRQDAMFYRLMWQTIHSDGYWQGEIWNKRKNGEIYPEWVTINTIKDVDGNILHHIGTFHDMTDREEVEKRIRLLAFYDPLTKLPNRRLFQDRIEQAIAANARSCQHSALLFLDLDRFKILNDTYGHNVGDQLLQEVARRLQSSVREGDTIARLGGDEFVMMFNALHKYTSEAAIQAKNLAEKVREALAAPYHLSVKLNQSQVTAIMHHSSVSIGVVLFMGHESSSEELMQHADLAMYEAKHAGRDAVCMFDVSMQAEATANADLERDLRLGLEEKQFVLQYQPQVDQDGRITGSEALLRWQHPQRGMVSPADFIPLAEESGLILPLGAWVLEVACAQLAIWNARQETAHLTLSVNVSALQFRQAGFVEQVLAVLNRTGAIPSKLKLELTESMLVFNVEDIIVKMTLLKARGVCFSLDDFGTGYSSLTYLKQMPLDQLKIDQGFVRGILIDFNDAAIAKMIIALAESMGLSVIAEGVENIEQRNFLSSQGCHAYQGYLFSRPLSLEAFDELVSQV